MLEMKDNNTPLHVAALHGNETVVFALINKFGCDVNTRGQSGRSLLHLASQSGNSSLIIELAKYISPLVVDDNGDTPLHVAIRYFQYGDKYQQCINTLLELNAPVMVRNNSGQSPRDIARSSWSCMAI